MLNTRDGTSFLMKNSHIAAEDGFDNLKEQIELIVSSIDDKPNIAIECAKSLLESMCKTIIIGYNREYNNDDNFPKLFKQVMNLLPFLPPSHSDNQEIRKNLEKMLNGLSTTLQAICELRNNCCIVSHGNEDPIPKMDVIQASFVAQTSDAIVGLLHKMYRQDVKHQEKKQPLEYDDNKIFNSWLDNQCGQIQILDCGPYSPSETLYYIDKDAYRSTLLDFQSGKSKMET